MTDGAMDFPARHWMPSRIPNRDALAARFAAGAAVPTERLPKTHEQRWYSEVGGGQILRVPYDGGPFDDTLFVVEKQAWDHTTCDGCTKVIPAMTLCYVTVQNPYVGLCISCYKTHVVSKISLLRRARWYMRRVVGAHGAA
jgi:hypothetical protein